MTDQTIPDVTDDDRSLARKWAERIIDTPHRSHPVETAAARVILHAVPAPPRPTLADMSVEERVACKRMQADTKTWGRVVIIVPVLSGGRAALLDRWGDVAYEGHAQITPRPDLPPLEWPGDTPAPAPATITEGSEWGDIDALTTACRESGRDQIVVTDCDGDVFVWGAGAEWWESGCPLAVDAPYTILHTGKKGGRPVTPAKVGDVIESADDPRVATLPVGTVIRDYEGNEFTKMDESIDPWSPRSGPGCVPIEGDGTEFGPWTVLRIGWEAYQ